MKKNNVKRYAGYLVRGLLAVPLFAAFLIAALLSFPFTFRKKKGLH